LLLEGTKASNAKRHLVGNRIVEQSQNSERGGIKEGGEL